MSKFSIVVDSGCDLELDVVKELGITCIPYNVSVDGKTFFKDRITMSPAEFAHALLDNPSSVPKTATPSPESYVEAFEQAIGEGKDVLCIGGTQTLTSVVRTAESAKAIVLEKHPDAQIEVLDSHLLTAAMADFIIEAVKLRDEDISLGDALKRLIASRDLSRIYFFIQSTKYLHLGGRIGKVGAVATDFLNIKPLIVLKGGEISPFGMIRSRSKGLTKIATAAKEYLLSEGMNLKNMVVSIAATDDVNAEVPILKRILESELGIKVTNYCYKIGPTVVAHTGPGTIGITLVGKA